MTKMMTAIAIAIATPAVANAQTAPAPAPKAEQGHKMTECKCCKDMGAKGHAGHHMPGAPGGGDGGHPSTQPGAKTPHADHQHNHQQ